MLFLRFSNIAKLNFDLIWFLELIQGVYFIIVL